MKSFWIQKIKVQLIICLLGHGVEFFFIIGTAEEWRRSFGPIV